MVLAWETTYLSAGYNLVLPQDEEEFKLLYKLEWKQFKVSITLGGLSLNLLIL